MNTPDSLTKDEIAERYGGAAPSDDLRWRVEHAMDLSIEQRLIAAAEIWHNATLRKYGCIPAMERIIRVRKLGDPDPDREEATPC